MNDQSGIAIYNFSWLSLWVLTGCLNFCLAEQDYPDLWDAQDQTLQNRLDQLIEDQGLVKQVQEKRLAITLVDIRDLHHPKLAAVNGEHMLYAASLPKIAILLGAFVEIEKGALKPDNKLWLDMNSMIRHSDNAAASRVLDRVGGERIIEILQDPEYALYDPEHHGGLWLGKAYSKGRAYQRDPLYNLSHGASSIQAARFYYLLETHQLLNPQLTEKMKEILSKPAINHKFVKGLQGIPGMEIYRKSGSWKQYHADSALVEFGEHKYIIVALAVSSQGGELLEELAAPLHNLIVKPQ